MNWTYSLERLPSREAQNSHIVQVTSGPRDCAEKVEIGLWTNLADHSVAVSPGRPVILYAEVKLNNVPVIDASVTAEIRAVNQSGSVTPVTRLELADNGNGDPDIMPGDGVYSKYLVQLAGEGRYTVTVRVDNRDGRAFVYQQTLQQNKTRIEPRKLGQFSRIVKGHSFRIHKMFAGSSSSFPPGRVMDLQVNIFTLAHFGAFLQFHTIVG